MGSFHDELRAQTSSLHEALESTGLSKTIVSEHLSKDGYVDYLVRMYQAHAAIEQNVFPQLKTQLPDIDQRHKLPLLEEDLSFLGASLPDNIPGMDAANDPGFLLGIMYVTEGSTLGGRVILKNVQKKLGLQPGQGATYFAGYGDDTAKMWKEFLGRLIEYEAQTGERDRIIAGANYAFKYIYEILK